MGFQNIEKKSFGYAFLKFWAQWWHNKIFYRKVITINPNNIPSNGHIIFTPNHQNALMDALGPLFTIKRQLVFLARADIFGKVFLAKILYFLKILPVFRIRDGYDSLKKNDAIFQKTIDVIYAGNGLVILPEGTHEGFHKLRDLKKGFARIAFKTEEENDYSMNMQILPIGLYYSDYENFQSILIVNFGKPIAVSNYYELYKINAAVAISKLRDELSHAIKSLMINIESENFYFLYDKLRQYRAIQIQLNSENKKQLEIQKFYAQQALISQLYRIEKNHPERIVELNKIVVEFEKLLKQSKLGFETLANKSSSLFYLLVDTLLCISGLPIFVYGYLNHFFPWQLTISMAGKIKDRQFRSSVKYLLSFLFFPLFYIIQTSIVFFLFPDKWIAFVYLLSLPFTAKYSWNYFKYMQKTIKNWKLTWLKSTNSIEYNQLNILYRKISDEMKAILAEK